MAAASHSAFGCGRLAAGLDEIRGPAPSASLGWLIDAGITMEAIALGAAIDVAAAAMLATAAFIRRAASRRA